MKPYEIPAPCTHPRRDGAEHCDACERSRLDASIARAGDALKRHAKAAEPQTQQGEPPS